MWDLIGAIVGDDVIVAVFPKGRGVRALYERPDGTRYEGRIPRRK